MKKILLFTFFFITFFLTQSNSYSQMPKGIYDVAGLWEMQSEKGIIYELWEIRHDGALIGQDFTIGTNNDTIIIEQMKIESLDSGVYYIATVTNQNEGKPIYYKMIEWTRNVFAFENKQHDFPQMIRYYIKTDYLYTVILEGPEPDNKIKSIE
ncbi:MAG: DUF6265 family protein, partial [Ignavibacteria bacterium]